jgi:hypothetical protein
MPLYKNKFTLLNERLNKWRIQRKNGVVERAKTCEFSGSGENKRIAKIPLDYFK